MKQQSRFLFCELWTIYGNNSFLEHHQVSAYGFRKSPFIRLETKVNIQSETQTNLEYMPLVKLLLRSSSPMLFFCIDIAVFYLFHNVEAYFMFAIMRFTSILTNICQLFEQIKLINIAIAVRPCFARITNLYWTGYLRVFSL